MDRDDHRRKKHCLATYRQRSNSLEIQPIQGQDMTHQQIADQLKALSEQMIYVGTAMDYYGGLGTDMAKRGAELISAGLIAEDWAEHMEAEIKDKT
jgi:hypothetical protein